MKIIIDVKEKDIFLDKEHPVNYFTEILFSFIDKESDTVYFDEMSFGYSIFLDKKEVLSESFPKDGVSYFSTDQEFLESVSLGEDIFDDTYAITVWVKNSGQSWEKTMLMEFPEPPSPYDSWVYDKEARQWKAPVPKPNDGKDYRWHEGKNDWVVFD